MPTAQESLEREKIGPAIGKVASGLYVATAQIGETPLGMLCSFVEQCSFNPPMISLAIAKDRPILQALDGHGLFGLHSLSQNNTALMKSFLHPHEGDPFSKHPTEENLFGIPQLTEAWTFLACKVAGKMVTGDHVLYTAEVFDGQIQHPGQEAMIRVRADGFDY